MSGTSYNDTGRYGVVREPDGSRTVVDKQKTTTGRYVLNTRDQNKAHREAARLNKENEAAMAAGKGCVD